jgi:hypothetical protein
MKICLSLLFMLVAAGAGFAAAAESNATGEASLSVESLLKALEPLAGGFKEAKTSVQKNEIRNRVREKAAEISKQEKMTIGAVIKDVRVTRIDMADLTFGDVNTGSYFSITNQSLGILVPGTLKIRISRENALKIQPGQAIQFSGRPVFSVSMGDILSGPFAHASKIFSITIKGDTQPLGMLSLADVQWKINLHAK